MDPADELFAHPRFAWREGMRDRRGVRVVELDLVDDDMQAPDLRDWATAGLLLQLLDETGRLTDVVRQDGEFVVAVDLPEDGVTGWAAESLGEAAAHALLGLWEVLDFDAAAVGA
jgi:hypothetical protein